MDDDPFKLITTTGAASRPEIPPNHFCRHNAKHMVMVHNTMIRGLNSVYRNSYTVKAGTQDAADLLTYSRILYDLIHDHHQLEEMTFFPAVEAYAGQPGLMSGNVEQHHEFEEGLENFLAYSVNTNKNDYDGRKLRDIIASFAKPFTNHLREEIGTILDLHIISSKDLQASWGKMEARARKDARLFQAPLVFGCQDREFLLDGEKVRFPEVPAFLPWMIHYCFSGRFAGAWRFNPSDTWGYSKESAKI